MAIIYKIINDINDKVYVGQTSRSLDQRWKEHLNFEKVKKKSAIQEAMESLGKEHFSIEKIETCPEGKKNEREAYWIEYYNSYENGYNRTRGTNRKNQEDDFYIDPLIRSETQLKIVKELLKCNLVTSYEEFAEKIDCDLKVVTYLMKEMFSDDSIGGTYGVYKEAGYVDEINGELIFVSEEKEKYLHECWNKAYVFTDEEITCEIYLLERKENKEFQEYHGQLVKEKREKAREMYEEKYGQYPALACECIFY